MGGECFLALFVKKEEIQHEKESASDSVRRGRHGLLVEANDDVEANEKVIDMLNDGSFYDLKPNLDCAEDETVEESENTTDVDIVILAEKEKK